MFYGATVVGLLYLRFTRPETVRPLKSSWITNILFLAVCLFITVIPFVPPKEYTSSIPYYLHSLIGIGFVLLCVPWWYFQVGRKKISPDETEREEFLKSSKYEDGLHSYYSPTLVMDD